ncbi:MAG: hypothetical protein CVT92_13445 [Bacteroidetes bacterium HGW-Bacteroidetes-1]|jgi:hypothetical protein|nr:MAG: hypothetical protein CVT92_13445 [Bacteroidetes bacterium HGW-Bacteroidetes-1]
MKLLFWKSKKEFEALSEGVLWPLLSHKKISGSQPSAWNNRFGEQHGLRKNLKRIWPLNQCSFL